MSIKVHCPGCNANFAVSDKFAGKKGPCPKCKAVIQVPQLENSKAEPEVKVHAPEEYASGGKDTQGRATLKPIARQETRLSPVMAAALVLGIAAVVGVAWQGGSTLQSNRFARAVGLALVSIPTVIAGYSFLRDDELEPYRGGALWLRATLCALAYLALWGVYALIPPDFTTSVYSWFFLAPPFFLVGAGVSLACLELDFGSGFFHYCFYVIVTLGLGWVAGLDMPWTGMVI